MAEESHILGVDFGKAKIGLAIADSETKMAFAFETLKNDKDFLKNLGRIIKNKQVKLIIIGSTFFENDKEGSQEKEDFAGKLEKEFAIPIKLHDEMFTTKMAQQNIKLRGGKNIAKSDDQEAARIILQSWLDCQV